MAEESNLQNFFLALHKIYARLSLEFSSGELQGHNKMFDIFKQLRCTLVAFLFLRN
ncbi:hypothetical protein rsdtw13_09930 [Clostridium sp. TW13]|uniref:Uncharacterized protein n=1 Tax=Inconstantimicrobium mannanitabidum TaxID=1604901 RepID=A0ACB5R9M2_9CLOT|nr:hypothetical protein rsdtw13_09930 [Clostridium sp. TW13]